MGYLSRDSTDLLKYARNVNCHFASKKCQDVIVAARKLMTSEMHNTVKVRLTPDISNYNCRRLSYKCSELCVHLPVIDHQISPDYKLNLPKLPSQGGGSKEKHEGKKGGQSGQQILENEKQLGQHTLCLPVCRISESVQQLMELAIKTLSEAVGSSPQWYVYSTLFTGLVCVCVFYF